MEDDKNSSQKLHTKIPQSGFYLKPPVMLTLTYLTMFSILVVFHFCCPPFLSSSVLIILHFRHLPFWSSSILVVFHFGRLPFWSSSIFVVFHFGRLPFWSSSILVVFHFDPRSTGLGPRTT